MTGGTPSSNIKAVALDTPSRAQPRKRESVGDEWTRMEAATPAGVDEIIIPKSQHAKV